MRYEEEAKSVEKQIVCCVENRRQGAEGEM